MSDAAALGETAAARAAAAAAQEASAQAEEAKANLEVKRSQNAAHLSAVLENPTPETARAYTDSLTAMMEAGKMYTASDKAAADAQNAAQEAAHKVEMAKQAAVDALTQEARDMALAQWRQAEKGLWQAQNRLNQAEQRINAEVERQYRQAAKQRRERRGGGGVTRQSVEFQTEKASSPNSVPNGMIQVGIARFVSKDDKLYQYTANIQPMEGFQDIVIHSDPDGFAIYKDYDFEEEAFDPVLKKRRKREILVEMTPKEMAKYIREMTSFEGKPIRLIACQSGAKAGGAAQQVADALGLTILAPTEIVNVNDLGEMFLSDNDTLADMWFEGERVQPTGKWITFEPRK